jgi:hypothetical protein
VKKKYFFGYLFARVAKGLAVVVILIGVAFCLLQYSQANTAADSVAYQPSPYLQRALGKLKDAFSATEHIVSAFNTGNQSTIPKVQVPRFPAVSDSNPDFARIGDELSRVDQERQQFKQSIVSRFETSVKSIEEKLHAYAAGLESLPPTPAIAPTPVSAATPSLFPTARQESLFSSKLSTDEASKRSANLTQRKEFLETIGAKAENADNRAILAEAADELDLLSKLLPEDSETSAPAQLESPSTPSKEPRAEQGRKVFLSERVAGQLEQLRGEVRQMLLTSWSLDDAFERAADLNSVERDKCRVATLARKGIWLSAVTRIGAGFVAAVLVSFLILVSADLVQTLLDTATNTAVMADAVLAVRGLARSSSQSESGQS